MKRFLSLSLALIVLFLLPSVASAKTTAGEIVGWWSLFTEDGFNILYVGEKQVAGSFETKEDESGNGYVLTRLGEWAIIGDNTVVFSFEDGSIQKTTYMNDVLYYHLPEYSAMIPLERVHIFGMNDLTRLELIP